MDHSDGIMALARILPFASWKDRLLVRHAERCPACAARLATAEEARIFLVRIPQTGNRVWNPAALLGASEASVRPEPSRTLRLRPAWRWTAAAAGFGLAVLLTWSLVRSLSSGPGRTGFASVGRRTADAPAESRIGPHAGSGDLRLAYIRIDNEPARAIVFKPRDSNLVLVWAGRY